MSALWCIHNQQDAKLLQKDINQHEHKHGKWILIHPNIAPYTLPKLQHIRWRTLSLLSLWYTNSDHFKYLGVTLQSNLRYDRHVQDITAKSHLHRRNAMKRCQNLITLIERMCIQGFSLTPTRIGLYCMVTLTKIPCRCHWESSVLFYLLHIVHHD